MWFTESPDEITHTSLELCEDYFKLDVPMEGSVSEDGRWKIRPLALPTVSLFMQVHLLPCIGSLEL